ncbi:MAG TPA: hypothetical protein VJQ56_08515, partial [Blastocatellia bacterium]|nr:hypothetical protein [Blastocatellia bacterium]
YRNPEDTLPAATGHAFELRSEGYVQRTSYIEVCETSACGRALALCGFEVKRGIASREEMDKAARMGNLERESPARAATGEAAREAAREPVREPAREIPKAERAAAPAAKAEQARPAQSRAEQSRAEQSKAGQSATDQQKQNILNLLEELRPGDRRAQRTLLMELTGKESRDDLTDQEARSLIYKLKREASRNSI